MEYEVGRVVFSKAGRDKGRKLVITEIVDEHYVLVADGSLRKLEKPKRKKRMHLKLTHEMIEIGTNKQLKRALTAPEEE